MSALTDFRSLASRHSFRAATLLLAATSLAGALFILAGSLMTSAAASVVPDTAELPLVQQIGTVVTVDATTDAGDALPGDGLCDDGSGACTLRAAIEEANARKGMNTIAFDIPGAGPHLIQPETPLPALDDPIIVDGTTEPDYTGAPVVVLDGGQAGERASGLVLSAGNSTVRGLALYGFDYAAIHLLGANNRVEGNYVGVEAGGVSAPGNGIGVLVEDAAANVIGGTAADAGNVISGNEGGVTFYGAAASDNRLLGNVIGLDASGRVALGNEYGVRITGADGNLIGGTEAGARNVISGNETAVYIAGKGASGNRIQGNYIGPDVTGTNLPGKQQTGIYINNAAGNMVGGATEPARNVIFGRQVGVMVRGNAAHGNLLFGNFIGTDAAGVAPDSRIDVGILVVDAPDNVVGGAQRGQGNRVAARLYGIRVVGAQAASNEVDDNDLDVVEDVVQDEEGEEKSSPRSSTTGSLVPPSGFLAAARRQEPMALFQVNDSPLIEKDPGWGRTSWRLSHHSLLQTGVTFTVDSTGDGADANAGDGTCDDGSGSCTLRAAIEEANATAGSDTIAFDMTGSGPHTIQPASQLPAVTEAVTIDGTTEPDYASSPVVELDGSQAGAGADGLVLQAASTVRGLAINRFDDDGIDVESGGSGSLLEGNYIGVNTAGSTALGNLDDGIDIVDASSVTVGGTTSSARNLISGNGSNAIEIKGSGAVSNTIQGNTIGADATGGQDLGNGSDGIYVANNAAGNTIGGAAAGAGNLISGNDQDGVEIDGAADNVLQGNSIGTNAAGTAALGNTAQGVRLDDAPNNSVGGVTSGAGNLISGNGRDGVAITGSGATGNLVQGNKIGTNAAGTGAIGNEDAGIYLYSDAGSNTIGGTTAGARNLVSGNSGAGIVIDDAETTGNTVQGNYVGTDVTGSQDVGNSGDGIYVTSSAAGNTIGGSAGGAGNVVSGNGESGVYIRNSSGTVVQGNLIGVGADGSTALGNDGRGVRFYSTSTGNQIGGTDAGEGNIIANNGREGVDVNNNSNDNPIRGNAIYANDDLGIDLGSDGADTNDTGDVDPGPNNQQNYPVLSSAHSTSASTTVTGTLNSMTNTQFTLDFYAGDSCDSSGYGEGEHYLGSDTVTTDGSGDASFSSTLGESTGGVAQVTATATDSNGNTSEFSSCVQASYDEGTPPSLQANFSAAPTSGEAPLQATFTDSSTPGGAADVWAWDFGDGGTSTAQHPVYTYTVPGVYTVTLTVTDTDSSETDSAMRAGYITVTDGSKVLADFSAAPVSGSAPLTVTFSNNSSGADTYVWDFGDGITSTLESPGHVYAQSGSYTVTLMASGPSGSDVLTRTNYITVLVSSSLDWWNDDFLYRRQLSLETVTPITDDGTFTNTVTVDLSTAQLIGDGKLQQYAKDLRLLYYEAGNWRLLPTQISGVVSPTVSITFPLQSNISGINTSYWIYYGNGAAERGPRLQAPPLTAQRVFTEVSGSGSVTPTIHILGDDRLAWAPVEIGFTSAVSPTAASHLWDFGDGTTSDVSNTAHTYTDPGVYTVTLTVTGGGLEVTKGYRDYVVVLDDRSSDFTITPGQEETSITSVTLPAATSGQLTSAAGDLLVSFPAAALTQTLTVTHEPFLVIRAQNPGVLKRFELTAATTGGQQVHQFAAPITLTLDLGQFDFDPTKAETILFFHWDEIDGMWEPITTTVNITQNIAVATTTHFSDFAVASNYGLGGPPLRRLPSVDSGGVDLLTGAATYAYALEAPPGTNGMQPNLSLIYNSGAADTLLDQQAGIVGHGFELAGLGWIQRDPYDTDTYYLNLNGVSEKLIPVEGASDSYRTEHETFWQIERKLNGQSDVDDAEYWLVSTQDGTQYRFGYNPDSASSRIVTVYDPYGGDESTVSSTEIYNLDRVQDVYSNTLLVEYAERTAQEIDLGQLTDYTVDTGAWVKAITYTENALSNLTATRRVTFQYGQPTTTTNDGGVRADYPGTTDYEYAVGPGLQYGFEEALQRIVMEVDIDGDGTFANIREYGLDYAYYTQNGEPPGSFGPEHYHLMLIAITEWGADGQSDLPTTSLGYHETGHVYTITNGYGGLIRYEYEKITESEAVDSVVTYGENGNSEVDGEDPDADRWRVTQRTVEASDGNGTGVFTYEYSPALFINGDFLGHQEAVVTAPDNSSTRTRLSLGIYDTINSDLDAPDYAQHQALWGRPYEVRVKQDAQVLSTVAMTYTVSQLHTPGAYATAPSSVWVVMGNDSAVLTSYTYDEYGNITAINEDGDESTGQDDRLTTISYENPAVTGGRITNHPFRVTVSSGAQTVARTEYDYDYKPDRDALDSVTVTQPDVSGQGSPSLVEYTHFDDVGNVDETWTGSSASAITYAYDPVHQSFLYTVTYPIAGLQETYEYDARFGVISQTTDINGLVTSYIYDAFGRLVGETGANGPVAYEPVDMSSGLVLTTTYQGEAGTTDDYVVTQEYNGLGLRVRTVAPGNVQTDYIYDGLGRQVQATVPYTTTATRTLTSTYDALGRPVRMDTLDGTTHYQYQDWQEVVVVDALGQAKRYGLDAFGRVISVTEANLTTSYEYDPLGNLTLIRDAAGNETSFTYDSLGQKRSVDDPNMGLWTYTYDSRGNLLTQIDARAVTTTLGYDALGRVISETYTIPIGSDVVDTAPVTYRYSGNLLAEMVDGSGRTTWHYDLAGRLLRESKMIDGRWFSTLYSYDGIGRLQTMTYPDGEVVEYTYDTIGQLEAVAGQDPYLSGASYNALGQPVAWNLGNVVTQTVAYDDDPESGSFRPTSVVAIGAGNTTIQDLDLYFDRLGRLDWWTNNQDASYYLDFEYDSLNRLGEVLAPDAPDYAQAYSYDSLGNLTNRDGLSLVYDLPQPQLPSSDSNGNDYGYDANGNLVTSELPDGSIMTYRYDAANRLTQVISQTAGSAITTTITYDGRGQKVKRATSSEPAVLYLSQHSEGISTHESNNVSNSPDESGDACIAVDQAAQPYVIWNEQYAGDAEILFKQLGGTSISLSSTAYDSKDPDIAVGDDDVLHAVWIQEFAWPDSALHYSQSLDNGLGWSTPVDISAAWHSDPDNYCAVNPGDCYRDGAYGNARVVSGSDDAVHIFWIQEYSAGSTDGHGVPLLLHRKLENDSWSDIYPLSVAYEADRFYDVAVGPDGQVHVVFQTLDSWSEIRYRAWNGSGWSTAVTLSPASEDDSRPAIAVDDNGFAHVAWANDWLSTKAIHYRYQTTTGWSAVETLDESSLTKIAPDLAVTSGGEIYATWIRSEAGMVYAQRTNGSWTTPLFVASSTATGLRPCRLAHELGGVHALYEDDVNGVADVFHLNLLPKIDIKRYFSGERQLAARVKGELHFILHDPTGTSLAMADEAGNGLGQILYDGYGAVLSATLPMTLSGTLLDAPDPTTHLVHLGEGRWYDPALGRPLQPNAAGGPPTVPQALNRYAATVMGQPGVAQAAAGDVFNWTPAAVSLGYGTVSEVAKLTVKVSQLTGYHYTGRGVVEATASFSALTRSRSFPRHLDGLFDSPILTYVENGRSFYTREAVLDVTGKSLDELVVQIDNVVAELVHELPKRKPWTAAVAGRLVSQRAWPQYSTKTLGQLENWSGALTGIGAGIDFLLGAGLQLNEDWNNPYLPENKVVVRVAVAGVGSMFSGLAGGAVGGAVAGLVCGPGVPVCSAIGAVAGAVSGGVVWSAWVQPLVFEAFPSFQPDARNLLPLD